MRNSTVRIIFIVLGFLTGTLTAGAQEAIPAGGGIATGQGGTVSFTVGQVVYTTVSGREHKVSQGVQQPYEISVVTFSEEIVLSGMDVDAYPNPTTDLVTLRVQPAQNQQIQPLVYELFDMTGRVLEKKAISADHTNIVMGHLAPATYFLKVYNTSGIRSSGRDPSVQSKTFKIIKK